MVMVVTIVVVVEMAVVAVPVVAKTRTGKKLEPKRGILPITPSDGT